MGEWKEYKIQIVLHLLTTGGGVIVEAGLIPHVERGSVGYAIPTNRDGVELLWLCNVNVSNDRLGV